MFAALFKKIVKETRWTIFWYTLILAAHSFLVAFTYSNFSGNTFFGGIENFLSASYFDFSWVLIISILCFFLGRRVLAHEIERGTSDFLFTLPAKRTHILAAKLAVFYSIILFVVAMSLLSLLVSFAFTGDYSDLPLRGLGLFFVVGSALALFLFSFASFFSMILSKATSVLGIAGGFFLISYALHIFSMINETIENFYFLSFFKYYGPVHEILRGFPDFSNIYILAISALVLLAGGMLVAEKRDL